MIQKHSVTINFYDLIQVCDDFRKFIHVFDFEGHLDTLIF